MQPQKSKKTTNLGKRFLHRKNQNTAERREIKRFQRCFFWWTRRGSNSRPLRCERSALPAELRAHIFLTAYIIVRILWTDNIFFQFPHEKLRRLSAFRKRFPNAFWSPRSFPSASFYGSKTPHRQSIWLLKDISVYTPDT